MARSTDQIESYLAKLDPIKFQMGDPEGEWTAPRSELLLDTKVVKPNWIRLLWVDVIKYQLVYV